MNNNLSTINSNPQILLNNIVIKIINLISNNNYISFKRFLVQSSNVLNPVIMHFILIWCFNNYNTIKSFINPYISFIFTCGVDPNINIYTEKQSNNDILQVKTPLTFAIEHNDISLINILLEHKTNANTKDHLGRTSVYYLTDDCNYTDILDILKNKGLNINEQDNQFLTAPMYYINENKEKIVYTILKVFNVDLFYRNKQGISLLEHIYEKLFIHNKGKLVLKYIHNKLYINNNTFNLTESSSSFSTSISSDSINSQNNIKKIEVVSEKLEDILNNNDNIIFKIPNEYTNKNNNKSNINQFLIKLNPKPVLTISGTVDYDEKIQQEKLINLEKKKNFSISYYSALKEYNLKLVEHNNNILDKITFIKDNIEKKKQILYELSQQLNSFSYKEYQTLFDQYNECTNKILALKEQKNILENFYTNNDNINMKYNIKDEYTQDYIINQLQTDLLDYKDYVSLQIDKSNDITNTLINLIKQYVKDSLGGDYDIVVYGSRATKLCIPTSDIDIVVTNPTFINYSPLFNLYTYILDQKIFNKVLYLGKAKVPIIKIQTNNKYNNINIDISLEDSNHYGVKCVSYILEKIKEYELLLPMTLAVKTILYKANLNDPYKGGLSSYGVILLIINYLKNEASIGTDISLKNLGRVFYSFLCYYGEKYDPYKSIITLSGFDSFLYAYYQPQINNGELVIVDPLNNFNNVGKNTRQFNTIKIAFTIAYYSAKEPCECGCHFQYEEFNLQLNKINHCILQKMFNAVKRNNI